MELAAMALGFHRAFVAPGGCRLLVRGKTSAAAAVCQSASLYPTGDGCRDGGAPCIDIGRERSHAVRLAECERVFGRSVAPLHTASFEIDQLDRFAGVADVARGSSWCGVRR